MAEQVVAEQVTVDQLIAILEDAKVDYSKLYDKGVKAASSRLRKKLQEVIKQSKVLRNQTTEKKNSIA
jgi:hypothetical protein